MPKYNKTKKRRELSNRFFLSANKSSAAAVGPNVFIGDHYHNIHHSTFPVLIPKNGTIKESVSKFSLAGSNLLYYFEKWNAGIYNHSLLTQIKDRSVIDNRKETISPPADKPEGNQKQEGIICKFFSEVSENHHNFSAEQQNFFEEAYKGWTKDLNLYIKKTIRQLKYNPLFPPGTLLQWNGIFPLKAVKSLSSDSTHSNARAIRNHMFITSPSRQAVFIHPNTTMFVLREEILFDEHVGGFFWDRIIHLMVTTTNKRENKNAAASVVSIAFNAFLSKSDLAQYINVLKHPSNLRKDKFPKFILPDEAYKRKIVSSRNYKSFLCLDDHNRELWIREANR